MKHNNYTKPPQKAVDFLHGNDPQFDKAMNSVNDMYEDLFKTTNYQNGEISDLNNLNAFDSINDMYNNIMGVAPHADTKNNKIRDGKETEQEEIVMGEPVDIDVIEFREQQDSRLTKPSSATNNKNAYHNFHNPPPVVHPSNPYSMHVSGQLPPVWAPPHKKPLPVQNPNPYPYTYGNNPYPF